MRQLIASFQLEMLLNSDCYVPPISLLLHGHVYCQKYNNPCLIIVLGGGGVYRDCINLLRDQISGSRETIPEEHELQVYLLYMIRSWT